MNGPYKLGDLRRSIEASFNAWRRQVESPTAYVPWHPSAPCVAGLLLHTYGGAELAVQHAIAEAKDVLRYLEAIADDEARARREVAATLDTEKPPAAAE